jgi:hypothetical protein
MLEVFLKKDSTEQARKARKAALREAKKLSKNIQLNDPYSKQLKEGIETVEVLSDTSEMKEDALQTISDQAETHLGRMDEYKQVDEVRNEIEQYTGDLTNLPETVNELKDTEKLGENLEQQLTELAGVSEITSQQKELEQLKDLPESYTKEMESLQDPQKLREEMIKKAKLNATSFVMKHSPELSEAQKSLTKLKRKYLSVPNANDLSTATKRNSLKGKPIKERLYLTGNFQILSSDPFSLDGMLSLGYRFNKKFILGTNGMYRQTFGHYEVNIPYQQASENVAGYGIFTRYEVKKGFFSYAEAERMNVEIKDKAADTSYRIWTTGIHAGIGRTFSFTKLLKTQVLFLYNFTHKQNQELYRQKFIVKFGVQLNEKGLAQDSR